MLLMVFCVNPLLVSMKPCGVDGREMTALIRCIMGENRVQIVNGNLADIFNRIACAAIEDTAACTPQNGLRDFLRAVMREQFTGFDSGFYMRGDVLREGARMVKKKCTLRGQLDFERCGHQVDAA